ncbi:MAG TPA: pre-peptidase C-terminal domain-containing protein [Arenimonas sp.]|nr:pre-peptidase C-terminal domain-containing protein [Arenimonas sp.]
MRVRFATRSLVGLSLLFAACSAQADVFINEIHYDNANTDVGEMVEVIAPAGTNLSGWSIALYNGGDGKRYATLALSGTTSNQCGGHGTTTVAAPGMQNGAPDGLALVDAAGQVVQFLSYEGSFSASDGPAQGLTSSNIGVAESSSTAAGQSLQLAGSGSSYAEFNWQAASTNSFGACNAGQSLTGGDTGGGDGSGGSADGTLGNGVARTGLAANRGDALSYVMQVPAGASNLVIASSGGSGDADLYVKFGSEPSTSSYDCRPYKNGNNESCSVASPQAGTWHVMLRAYSSFSGVTLVGSFDEPSAPPPPSNNVLQKAVPVSGLAASSGSALDYTIEVPAGASDLSLSINGGSGDADLYLRHGSAPTTSSYDCRPYLNGNAETCSVATPAAGTWHVMVRAYTSFSGVTLLGDYTAATGGGGGGGDPVDPGQYYTGVDASNAAALRASLHALIDDHTRFPYSASTTDTWDVLEFADQDPLDPTRVLDIYRNQSYAKAGGGNTFYNREHTWPKSLGFPDDTADNYPYTDAHMLMISAIDHNASRGNLPFGNCHASCNEFVSDAYNGVGGGSGVFPGNSNWSDGVIWQVWSQRKGDVARAILYMDLRYEGGTHGVSGGAEPDLRLTDDLSLVTMSGSNANVAYMGKLSVLLQWHAEDPVTEAERLRNSAVQSHQGNRNPFVDHPEWVVCVYQNVCN